MNSLLELLLAADNCMINTPHLRARFILRTFETVKALPPLPREVMEQVVAAERAANPLDDLKVEKSRQRAINSFEKMIPHIVALHEIYYSK